MLWYRESLGESDGLLAMEFITFQCKVKVVCVSGMVRSPSFAKHARWLWYSGWSIQRLIMVVQCNLGGSMAIWELGDATEVIDGSKGKRHCVFYGSYVICSLTSYYMSYGCLLHFVYCICVCACVVHASSRQALRWLEVTLGACGGLWGITITRGIALSFPMWIRPTAAEYVLQTPLTVHGSTSGNKPDGFWSASRWGRWRSHVSYSISLVLAIWALCQTGCMISRSELIRCTPPCLPVV